MNNSKNLYKLDDFFLILSYILVIFLLILLRPVIIYAIAGKEGIQEFLLEYVLRNKVKVGGLAASIFFLQILGRLIRREEKVLVTVLDTVIMYKTISINQLQNSLGLDKSKIEKYLGKLSNIGRLNIHFDGIYARLETDTRNVSRSDPFHETGNRSEGSFHPSREGDQDTVFSEKGDVSESDRNGETSSLRVSAREDLQQILTGIEKPMGSKSAEGKKFNIALFLILFFVFWPGAFIYAARFYMTSNKKSIIEERLKKRLSEMER